MGDFDLTQVSTGMIQTWTQQDISKVIEENTGNGGMFEWLTMWWLIAWFFISFLGLVYFGYGKKNWKLVALFCWIIMMVYPYFVYKLLYLILIGVVLCVLPFVIKE